MTQHFAGKALNADVQPARTWTGHSRRLRNPARNDGVHRALGTAPPSLLVGKPGPLRPRPVHAGTFSRPSSACLPALRRATYMHRQPFGAHGNTGGSGVGGIALPIAPDFRSSGACSSFDHHASATPSEERAGGFEPLLRPAKAGRAAVFRHFCNSESPSRRSRPWPVKCPHAVRHDGDLRSQVSLGLWTSVRFAPRSTLAHCPPSPATTISGRCWTRGGDGPFRSGARGHREGSGRGRGPGSVAPSDGRVLIALSGSGWHGSEPPTPGSSRSTWATISTPVNECTA